jgi:hypothetical protein
MCEVYRRLIRARLSGQTTLEQAQES